MTGRSKAEWRQRAKQNRAGLRIEHHRVVEGLQHFLATMAAGGRTGWVVIYDAMAGEPDVSELSVPPFRLALTRTPDRVSGEAADLRLTIHPASSLSERHPFGYSQPVPDSPVVPDSEVTAVLVPGLAFGMDGARLGHGAGYYDRLLSRLDGDVLRIGVSDGFIVSGLPMEPHDVPMTHLATEAGVFPVG